MGRHCLDPSLSRAANAGFGAVCACIVCTSAGPQVFFLFLFSFSFLFFFATPESGIINQQQQGNRSRNDLCSVHIHHGHRPHTMPLPG